MDGPRSGGQVLVDQLLAARGRRGLRRARRELPRGARRPARRAGPIRLVVCRHEAGAANMAEAYGKLTGRPGICLVTRGPGATHAAVGVHTAFQDSTPMILLVGQVGARAARPRGLPGGRLSRAMFGPLAKWAAEIDDAARIPELVSRAFHVATSGRPGPVVLGAARGHAGRRGGRRPTRRPYQRRAAARRATPTLAELRALLDAARAAADRARRRRRSGARRPPTTCAPSPRPAQLPVAAVVPPPGPPRQRLAELRRRRRPRRQPAARARASREADLVLALGRPPRRGADRRLHAARVAAPAPDARPRPPRRRRARPRLPARPRDRRRRARASRAPRPRARPVDGAAAGASCGRRRARAYERWSDAAAARRSTASTSAS